MSYRLCLVAILNAKPGDFTALMGFLCSSWTPVNMGTSGRSVADPLGHDHKYVQDANCMASRFSGYICGIVKACHALYPIIGVTQKS